MVVYSLCLDSVYDLKNMDRLCHKKTENTWAGDIPCKNNSKMTKSKNYNTSLGLGK